MGRCCKGKQEGNDLKFFKLLSQISKELGNRTHQQIIADITVPTKKTLYKQLYQLLKLINEATGGGLD